MALNGEKRENEIYHPAHLFLSSLVDRNSRIEAGYNLRNKRVEKIVEAIIDSQLEDGGWQPFWSEKSDSVYTALALKLLASLNGVNVRGLRASVNRLRKIDCMCEAEGSTLIIICTQIMARS